MGAFHDKYASIMYAFMAMHIPASVFPTTMHGSWCVLLVSLENFNANALSQLKRFCSGVFTLSTGTLVHVLCKKILPTAVRIRTAYIDLDPRHL